MPFNCFLHSSIWQFSFFCCVLSCLRFLQLTLAEVWFPPQFHKGIQLSGCLQEVPSNQSEAKAIPSPQCPPACVSTGRSRLKMLTFGYTDPGKRKLVHLPCWFVLSWRYPGSFWQFSFCRNRSKVWTKCAQICWRKSVRRSVNLKVEVCHWGGSGVQGSSSRLERVEAK